LRRTRALSLPWAHARLELRFARRAEGDKVRHRSVPEILESLGVASLGLAAADADHVKTFRAGLERADDRRSDAQDVPR
jgi:hypothetical protein